jgi:hypothetical protein
LFPLITGLHVECTPAIPGTNFRTYEFLSRSLSEFQIAGSARSRLGANASAELSDSKHGERSFSPVKEDPVTGALQMQLQGAAAYLQNKKDPGRRQSWPTR